MQEKRGLFRDGAKTTQTIKVQLGVAGIGVRCETPGPLSPHKDEEVADSKLAIAAAKHMAMRSGIIRNGETI